MNIWKRNKPSISFEFYPAQTEKGTARLKDVISELLTLSPDFMSVTFGAGGSSRKGSLELLQHLRKKSDIHLTGYLAAYGLGREELADIAGRYQAEGVNALLAVRGDIPQDNPLPPHPLGCPHAADLVRLMRRNINIPVGVAAYPEGHVETDSREKDWSRLLEKISCGAEFIITQYFYDNRDFFTLRDFLLKHDIKIPILAGIMPIYNSKTTYNLAQKCGATIPGPVRLEMDKIEAEDKESMNAFGVELALTQCRELLKNGVDGLHFYTMNRSQSTSSILKKLREERLV